MKRIFAGVLAGIITVFIFITTASATEITNETKYQPLDLVVVLDISGSMNDSDPDRLTSSAVKMLVNMMPAQDSRVGIVLFNQKATVVTDDGKGNPDLISLADLNGVNTIKGQVDGITCRGNTGIGNALLAATDLLNARARADSQKVIILFTDGINEFGRDKLGLSECESNESSAVLWAKQNSCPVYCVGYNYITPSGAASMGPNGEGITRLNAVSDATGGTAQAIANIKEVEDLFISILADICSLYYNEVETVLGDGQRHEVDIPINVNVVEANIRISCATADSIKNGTVELTDPEGYKCLLKNKGNIRYDVDATAASIKVILPQPGDWLLVLEGIEGEDIKIGLLEHYDLDIASVLVLPAGNPEGVAYSDDEIGIKTWLTTEGEQIADEAIYDTITSAEAICTPRSDPENPLKVRLSRDGASFVGSFTLPQNSYYDVKIELVSDRFYREDNLTIKSDNRPLVLLRELEKVDVNKGKTVTIDNLLSYVADQENDKITIAAASISDPAVADVTLNGEQLTITGSKWSSGLVTVIYQDAQGNRVESTFKTEVHDPLAVALIIAGLAALVLVVLALLYLSYKKTFRITGHIRIARITESRTNELLDCVREIFADSHGGAAGFQDSTAEEYLNRRRNQQSTDYDGPQGAFSTARNNHIPADDDYSPKGAFADYYQQMSGQQGANNQQKAADTETLKDEQLSREFDGAMELGMALMSEKNLNAVLETFIQNYQAHMTINNSRDSQKAQEVADFIKSNFLDFSRVTVSGTPFGRQGIVLHFARNLNIKCHNQQIRKQKLAVKASGDQLILLKFSVPMTKMTDENTSLCAYIEIEYIN